MREQVLNQKVELVSEIKERFDNAASAVVVEYRGLNVKAITDLRSQLHNEGVEFKVYKNTMTRRAAEEAGLEDLLDALVGPNAIAFSDDAIAPSRILSKFAKKNKALVIKKGLVEGKVVDVDKLKELADLPNKEGMIAMLLGALQSPIRDFAWAVKQISELDSTPAGEETEATPEVVEESVSETVEEVEAKESVEASVEAVEEAETVQELVEEVEAQPVDENEVVEEVVDNETSEEVVETEEEN